MQQIKKSKDQSAASTLSAKLSSYKSLAKNYFKENSSTIEDAKTYGSNSLKAILGLTATALAPVISNGQCLIGSNSVDVNNDGVADLQLYSFFTSQGYSGAIRSIFQLRASALNGAYMVGDQFFPRACYYNDCLFPYANGATTGINYGSVGALFQSVFSANYGLVTYQSCTTTSSGSTSCFTFSYSTITTSTSYTAGHFSFGSPGELALNVDGQWHFIEFASFAGISEIDGVNAQNCDPDGCLDDIYMLGNTRVTQPFYHAENFIRTDDRVRDDFDVTLLAGNFVHLQKRFKTGTGANFLADIVPCSGLSLRSIPSTIKNFEARSSKGNIELSWKAEHHYEKRSFDIERSTDNKTFLKIANKNPENLTHGKYFFVDEDTDLNQRYYYRLKQTGLQGEAVYSKVQAGKVVRDTKNSALAFEGRRFEVVDEYLKIFSLKKEQTCSVELFSSKGESISTKQLKLDKGQNTIDISTYTSDFPNLYVKITLGEKSFYRKANNS